MAAQSLPFSSPSTKRDQRCAPTAADTEPAHKKMESDSDKEPPFVITETKSTIPFWCQRARFEDASEGWDHKREKNELERLKDKVDTSKAMKKKAEVHLATRQHCRNLSEDILNNLSREQELVDADCEAACDAQMSYITL